MYRFAASVFPSEDDDVVTSPYNALLSLAELTKHADCVLPMENQALLDITTRLDTRTRASPCRPSDLIDPSAPGGAHSFPFVQSFSV